MADITDYGASWDKNFKKHKQEVAKGHSELVNWPDPVVHTRFIYEKPELTMEQVYYQLLNNVREDLGCPDVRKITDIMAASEQSGIWQSSAQRIGLQQDKAAQYLQSIGALTKQLFQLVKELRALKERVDLYNQTMDPVSKKVKHDGNHSAEIALKGYWVDLVQGGIKNPASVLGMGREIGYVVLPDLFFGAPIMNKEDIDKYCSKLEFNRKIRELLARHLNNFYIWKETTFDELLVRQNFTLKYLRQHYNTIRMYITWIKPYLRNIRRLTLDTGRMMDPDMLSSFESAMIETEFLALNPTGKKDCYACLSVHIVFRTKASMESMGPQAGYRQAPIYTGRADVNIRAYGWHKEHVDAFLKFKEKDDLDMIASIDSSLQAALDALGDEFLDYLKEAGEEIEGKKQEEKTRSKVKIPSVWDTLLAPAKGIYELFFPMAKIKRQLKKEELEEKKISKQELDELNNAVSDAKSEAKSNWYKYVKLFKKKWKIPY